MKTALAVLFATGIMMVSAYPANAQELYTKSNLESMLGEDFNLMKKEVTGLDTKALDPNIVVTLEEPTPSDIKSGVYNIRGWAVTPYISFPIVRIDWYIDGVYQGTIPYGALRQGVCSIHPYPECENSAFGKAHNYNNFSPGLHTITVRAVDSFGDYNQAQRSFFVEKFNVSFQNDPNLIDFLTTQVDLLKNSSGNIFDKRIRLRNVFHSGTCYDVILNWYTPIQGWRIVDITQKPIGFCQ